MNWLEQEKSRSKNPPDEDAEKKGGISIAKFEDDGSFYVMAFDWTEEEVQEWLSKGEFFDAWENTMSDSQLVITSGKIGDGGDIQVVKTSLDEIFKSDEQKSSNL